MSDIAKMTEFSLWVVYDHPKDLPHWYVARRWETEQPTEEKLLSNDLDHLRTRLRARGLVCLTRNPADDPCIVETWL